MKAKAVIICLSFLIPVFFFGIYSFANEKSGFSELENRELAKAPSLFVEAKVNQKYYYEYEKYYTDAFPLREKLLEFNRKVKSIYTLPLFQPKDSVVFVTEVDNMPIVNGRTFETFNYNEQRTKQYVEIVDELAAKCDVPTFVILPPSASELYLPTKYKKPENEQKPSVELLKTSFKIATFIDTYDDFQSAKADYLYFKTDHHWTADGAYVAYKKFAQAAKFEPTPLDEMESGKLENFLGSLYKKISQSELSEPLKQSPDFVQFYEPLYKTKVVKYQTAKMVDGEQRNVLYPNYNKDSNLYNVFFGGDMSLMHMKSDVANGKSIMVVRDSYGHAFLPFLANNYENIYAIEPRYFETFPLSSFIKEHKIDELLFIGYALPATSNYWMNWVDELEKLD